jgi:hypothetical protein
MRRRIHPLTVTSIVSLTCALCLGSPRDVGAGANPDFRIVLHGKQSSFEPCTGYLPVDCLNNLPNVNVPAAPLAVFVLLYRVNQGSGLQTGLQWPGWTQTFSLWDCLPGPICDPLPCQPIPHPNGIIADFDFNCVTTPGLHALGRIFLLPAGNPGCVSQWIPDRPNGIHMRDCSGGVDIIDNPNSIRLGKICVGAGGVTGCDDIVPVEPVTWGKIKATY